MTFDDVVEMAEPAPDSQYRLVNCECGSADVVYLHCKDAFGQLVWRVKCMDCMAETRSCYTIRHDAQIAWNIGKDIAKP
jgi:hypothetical protein